MFAFESSETLLCQWTDYMQQKKLYTIIVFNILSFLPFRPSILIKINSYYREYFQNFQAKLRKGKETKGQIANIRWSQKKQENSRKTSASLTTLKPLTVWITTNCENFLKRWEYQTPLPASCEMYMQIRKQQLELDVVQQTGSKLGKEYMKAV